MSEPLPGLAEAITPTETHTQLVDGEVSVMLVVEADPNQEASTETLAGIEQLGTTEPEPATILAGLTELPALSHDLTELPIPDLDRLPDLHPRVPTPNKQHQAAGDNIASYLRPRSTAEHAHSLELEVAA